MSLIFDKKIKGSILFNNSVLLYKFKKGKILTSCDQDISWNIKEQLPETSSIDNLAYRFHFLSRLLRKGVHHFYPIDKETSCFIYNKRIKIVSKKNTVLDLPLQGSRPLSFEIIDNKIFFGEYRSNPERTPISVFSIDLNSEPSLQKAYTFYNIRHIHGVYKDPYTSSIYITTGDQNNESAIFRSSDNLKSVEKVLSGSQQTRAIKLLFDSHFIYFGSDTPNEQNHLYKLNRETKNVTRLTEVGSSVFHGCKVGDWLFFSTAIEPSNVNKTKYAEVWASPDGNDWRCILRLKKDVFPMKYFQYGQIFFPKGPGDDENLWLSPFATKFSNKSIKIPLEKIKKHFKK